MKSTEEISAELHEKVIENLVKTIKNNIFNQLYFEAGYLINFWKLNDQFDYVRLGI